MRMRAIATDTDSRTHEGDVREVHAHFEKYGIDFISFTDGSDSPARLWVEHDDLSMGWRWSKDFPRKPEQVEVIKTGNDFWLVVGDEHTTYRGELYPTREALLQAQIEDGRRSIKYGEERIAEAERLLAQ